MGYFITEASTNAPILVQFAPLTLADEAELRGADWQQAIFRDVWPNLTQDSNTFKLVRVGGENACIQGLLRVGRLIRTGGLLKKSLLETASFNRRGQDKRLYSGVGRVLVVRLVVESVLQGGQGRVAVSARRGTEAFYRGLGFRGTPIMRLSAEDAETVLRTAFHQAPGG